MGMCVIPKGGWRIHNYKAPQSILMGYEYEIEVAQTDKRTSRVEQLIPAHYSYAYEGLSSVNGYEVKSSVAPLMTLKREARNLVELWNWCIRPGNEGGIHINVSRNEFTDAHYKVVFNFLHDPNNFQYLFDLSARTHNSFSLNAVQIPDPTRSRGGYDLGPGETGWMSHYGIITKRKRYAYEFRMFGTCYGNDPLSLRHGTHPCSHQPQVI
jgi:hypothetical protein